MYLCVGTSISVCAWVLSGCDFIVSVRKNVYALLLVELKTVTLTSPYHPNAIGHYSVEIHNRIHTCTAQRDISSWDWFGVAVSAGKTRTPLRRHME